MPRVHVTTSFVAFCLFSAIMTARELQGRQFVDTPNLPQVSSDPESLTAFVEAMQSSSGSPSSMPVAWVLIGGIGVGLVYALSILAHELGHYLTARSCRVGVEGITLNGAGGFVEFADDARLTRPRFALIVVAGPLVTALLVVATYLLYRIEFAYTPAGVVGQEVANYALLINVVALVVNLLPFPSLDGGQLLRTARLKTA